MSHQQLPFECTSADFEKAAIQRFRELVSFFPPNCRIFREPWDNSTVLCFDFADCPRLLEVAKGQVYLLIDAIQELGLANTVIFRLGNKFMGWKAIAPSREY